MEFAFTGFGTAGYAISDESFRYLRYIDDRGTFKADSLLGFQAEAKLNEQWGATVQAVASAPRNHDQGYETTIRWAFVGYRPSNEWLFRLGRLRPPVFVNTQNAEVGVTYDQARLPVEVYALSPTYDVDGGAITKTWALQDSEINFDAYWGKSDITVRVPFQRVPPPLGPPNPSYFPSRITLAGLVLSYASGPLFLRAGVHQARTKLSKPVPENFEPTVIPGSPPSGGTLWLPLRNLNTTDATVLTFGVDWRSGDWRVTGEYGQRIVTDTKLGFDSKGGYATVARSIGNWTPYVSYARLLSGSDNRNLYRNVDSTPVPLLAQQQFPADFHHFLADSIFIYDQYSTMLGTVYGFSPTSKVKLEWMRVHVGLGSGFVDGDVRHQGFNVFSLSYSFAF